MSRPPSSETTPLSVSPMEMITAHASPSSTSQKYSNELNLRATSASDGAAVTSTTVPKMPPMTENTRSAPSTVSACPFLVIMYDSSVYAADAGVPGMRISAPGMSPEKIAIAVAVTIDAIAGTGGMKKVTGTRSAVAIVAVRPGTAPTKSPKIADSRMTKSVYGSNTSPKAARMSVISPREALEDAPGQRHPQQLVEQRVNEEGRDERDHDGANRRDAELEEQRQEADRAREEEAERVRGEDIEDEDGADREEVGGEPGRAEPRGDRDQRRSLAQAAHHEHDSGQGEADRDHAGEERGPVVLAWNERVALDVDEDRRGERDQERANEIGRA